MSKEAYEPSPKAKGRRTRLEKEDKRIIEKEEYRKVANEVFSIDKKQLNKIINSKKKEIVDKVYEYAQENDLDRISYNKLYEIMSSGNEYNRTRYSATELAIAFEVYKSITADLTLHKPKHTPSIQNFCAFIGISTATYESYKQRDEPDLVDLIQKIDDYIVDTNLTNGSLGIINPGMAMFRAKTEHGYVEQKEQISITNQVAVDRNDIAQRLKQVKGKTNK